MKIVLPDIKPFLKNIFSLTYISFGIFLITANIILIKSAFSEQNTFLEIVRGGVAMVVIVFSLVFFYILYKAIREEKLISALEEEIESAKEKLHVMEEQKVEFISIASHQLRTPLTVIKGYASMILEGTFGAPTDRVRDAVTLLYSSSGRIVDLVDELLTVSRLEQGRTALDFTPVNFTSFVRAILEEKEKDILARGLKLTFDAEESKEFFVSIDEKKFGQVLRHLIDNATEFTKAPGEIDVAIIADTAAKKIAVSITDTGMGMTTEQIKALFERFDLKVSKEGEIIEHQESPYAQKISGIGIYVAKEIVYAHHGNFWAESGGVNRGTTFTIELPLLIEQ